MATSKTGHIESSVSWLSPVSLLAAILARNVTAAAIFTTHSPSRTQARIVDSIRSVLMSGSNLEPLRRIISLPQFPASVYPLGFAEPPNPPLSPLRLGSAGQDQNGSIFMFYSGGGVARVVYTLDVVAVELSCAVCPDTVCEIAIPVSRLSYLLDLLITHDINTYSFKRNLIFVRLFPIHEEDSVRQDDCDTISHFSRCSDHWQLLHVIAPHWTSFVPFFQPGRAQASCDRLLYRRSSLNWCFVESLVKSGGHSFFALYGLFSKSKRRPFGVSLRWIRDGNISSLVNGSRELRSKSMGTTRRRRTATRHSGARELRFPEVSQTSSKSPSSESSVSKH
jgi:hypothetical protein